MAARNIVIAQKVAPNKVQRAKELRGHMTEAENTLWAHLRANRLNGWHFRRQQIIGGFITDFYCHATALAIEVDGDIHKYEQEYDQERTRLLADYGIEVVRFKNETVLKNLPEVLGEIDRRCQERAAHIPTSRRRSTR